LPSLRLCKNENTRKKLLEAKESQCQTVNAPLLEELVQKRHEYANLLGYSSLSEYILSIRMAKSPINVQNFLENLTIKIS
jgi:Zn-dependent oligopeptidase